MAPTHTPLILHFVVNGEDVHVHSNPDQPLFEAMVLALVQSRNTGRPPLDWEIFDENGRRVDPQLLAGAVGARLALFLCLAIGAGGAAQRRRFGGGAGLSSVSSLSPSPWSSSSAASSSLSSSPALAPVSSGSPLGA